MASPVIRVENLSKLYRLGEVGTGSLAHDINRWWHRLRGKEDPYSQVGQINDRTRRAESDWVYALKDINFDVNQGEVLGIIGRNGAGKSTLLKILSRVTAPTKGNVKVRGRIASLLEVGTGFHPELTGRENIYLNGAILGMRTKEIEGKLDQIVDFSGCEAYLDTPVKRYSSGMTVRLAFAVAAHLEPEILVVDEVLAVGDAEFQKKCLGKMKDASSRNGRTILFVSHQLTAIQSLCSQAMFLDRGSKVCLGGVDQVIGNYLDVRATPAGIAGWPLNEAPGGEAARILSIQTIVDGQTTSTVPVGSDVEIRIDYQVLKGGARIHCAFHLCDYNGSCIFAATNLPSACKGEGLVGGSAHAVGRYKSEFTIPAYLLNAIHFTVSAFLATDVTLPEAVANECLSFQVHDSPDMCKEFVGTWPGLLRPRLVCQTQALN